MELFTRRSYLWSNEASLACMVALHLLLARGRAIDAAQQIGLGAEL